MNELLKKSATEQAKAIKNKDAVLGRFLAIQLANAIFGMFTLTISMIMAFGDNFNEMKPLALTVGIVATMLINAVAVTQFVLAQKLAATTPEPETAPKTAAN